MLTAIRESDGGKLAAWEAERGARPFVCPCCGGEVTLRRGPVIAPHFAHRPPVTCEYGAGESEAHRRCKLALYESLRADPRVTKCELERDLGTVRPDVSAYVGRVPVAVEVQLSSLSLERIARRTSEYARKGVYVLWLPPYTPALAADLYAPRPWELWLHAAYGGRVYYWLEGLAVQPIHFRAYYAQRRGRTRDYQTRARHKVPLDGRVALITDDFAPLERAASASQVFTIPRAKLWADKQADWY
ncbi:MAG TPA: competence protein CoiA family protein [Pyrinomonadaceae bacterium]|jgi:competence protein CoiA